MVHRSAVRERPAVASTPRVAVVQPDTPAQSPSAFTTLLESATQEILAVTYWFNPAPRPEPYPVTIQFTGRRADAQGRLLPGDRFSQDEVIEKVVPGSGPISVTAKIRGLTPGKWVVTARVQEPASPKRGPKEPESTTPASPPSGWLSQRWRKWAPSIRPDEHLHTCLTPWVHVPGILPGIWGAMVALGVIIALVIQSLVIAHDHLTAGPTLMVSLISIAVGVLGAKVWYIATYRRERLIIGWCIQGFIAGATLMAAILLVALHMPAGIFLDATASGLLLAMAVGRVGCFFAGCCGGPPTASRWGIWSSDQSVGARRIPTQLMEMALAGILGLGTLVAVLSRGPAGGAYFVGGLAAYTLVRQGILSLRAEPRRTKLGLPITAALAALVLIAAIVFLAH